MPKDIFIKTYIAGWVEYQKLRNQQNVHSPMNSVKINRGMMHSYGMLCCSQKNEVALYIPPGKGSMTH